MIIHLLPSLIRFKFPHGEHAKVCQEFVSGKPVRLFIYDWDQELIDHKYIQPVYGKVQGALLYLVCQIISLNSLASGGQNCHEICHGLICDIWRPNKVISVKQKTLLCNCYL